MVRRAVVLLALVAGCKENRPMADQVEMPHADSSLVANPMRADSMLDTMPGGEMARGNDSAAMKLLRKKM